MITVAVIPARAGSVGIPGKNLRRVGGLPLVARTIRLARAIPAIDRTIVSTDSEQIADVAQRHGAEAPFLRPVHLAADDIPTLDVVREVVRRLETAGDRVETIVTLQPTSPFCRPQTVAAAIARLRDPAVDSVTTVADLGMPASVVGTVDGHRLVLLLPAPSDARRQASPPAVRLTGAAYVTRRRVLDAGMLLGPRTAFVMTEGAEAMDIDGPNDLRRAQRIARQMDAIT